MVPRTWGLLEPIEWAREKTHMVGKDGIDESSRLLIVDLLCKLSVEKGIGDVHLMYRPGARDCEVQNCPNRARLDNRSKRVGEVDASALTKAADDPTRLVPLKGTVGAQLLLEDPFAGDDVGARGTRDERPSPVPL